MTDKFLRWFFFLQCQLLLLLAYSTDGFEGGADAICHWMISRDAPSNPMLFLDQWNKPIFTILSAPFAQFGLLGMRVFSALTGILTGVVLYRTAKEHLGELAWLPAIFLLFTPKYLTLLTSSMTEPLFGLFLSLFILFVAKNRMGWAAIIAGIAPFVRQEGLALLPIAGAALIYVRQFQKLPLLFVGTAVFTLVGWVVSGDAMWILTSFPYSSNSSDIYGSGELFHFLGYYKILFGIPITILFLVGSGFLFQKTISKFKNNVHFEPFELALLSGLFFSILFFSAHSYVWWKGLSGSAGLIRVMASFAPAMALVAAYGVVRLFKPFLLRKAILRSMVLAGLILASAFQVAWVADLPTPLGESQITIRRAANWLIEQQPTEKVHYSDPVFSHFAGNLNFDSPINKGPLLPHQMNELGTGEYIVWDTHFSPNEGRLPLDSLIYHPYLKKVKSFKPIHSFTAFGQPYIVHVFRKTNVPVKKEMKQSVLLIQDFETVSAEFEVAQALGRDGSKCAVSNKEQEYVTIRKTFDNDETASMMSLEVTVWVRSNKPLGSEEFFLVTDAGFEDKQVHYLSTSSKQIADFEEGKWIRLSQVFQLPQHAADSLELKCYVWNPAGLELLVDDFELRATKLTEIAE